MKCLEDVIQAAGNPVDLLRHSPSGPNVYPGVPPEYTNWRDEQQAWQKTCVLFNLSFHMADLHVEGADATKLLSHLAINSFRNVSPGRAKQFVPCSYDGHVIGDVILFNSAPRKYVLVGRIPALNWIAYHAETGRYDVEARARRALGGAQGSVQPQVLPLPDPGSERDEDHGEGARREAAGSEVLPRHDAHHRRQAGHARCATAWRGSLASSWSDPMEKATRCVTRS